MASKTGLEKMYPNIQILPMFTTYYSMCNKLDLDKFLIIKIFRSEKIDFNFMSNGTKCTELYPSAELLQGYKLGTINEKEYISTYAKQLSKLDVKSLLYYIYNKCAGGGPNPDGEGWFLNPRTEDKAYEKHLVFVCVEGPDKFCHRHIVAEWLKFYGYECNELKFN